MRLTLSHAIIVLTVSCLTLFNQAVAKVIALGDSTMSTCRSAPLNTNTGGWGTYLSLNVPVVNLARSGDSIRSASRDGVIQKGLTQVAKGDYVLLQYGRNDDNIGTGKETCDAPKPTTGKTCKGSSAGEPVVLTFIDWMTQVAKQFKAKGAEVIIVSVTTINPYRSATFSPETNPFVAQANQAARNAGVAFVDMHTAMTTAFRSQNAAQLKQYYVGSATGSNDITHLTPLGAQMAAKSFIAALRASTSTLKQHVTTSSVRIQQVKCPAR